MLARGFFRKRCEGTKLVVSTGDVGCSGSAFAQWAMAGQIFCAKRRKFGGDRRDRTDDLKLAKLALSQLSYVPAVARKASYGVASPPRNEVIADSVRPTYPAETRRSGSREAGLPSRSSPLRAKAGGPGRI